MDSMKSLGGSLPAASPPEQLLGAFKEAALSVTKLYKLANADHSRARAEGYQDALDELLSFLDKEDIGLSDGEGWRIRRWATERLDGRAVSPNGMETDDEAAGDKQDRVSSPEIPRSHSASRLSPQHQAPQVASPVRAVSQPPPVVSSIPPPADQMNVVPPQGLFTFQSPFPYPQVTDIDIGDLELSDNTRAQNDPPHSTPSITVSRPSRTNLRHNNHPGRPTTRGGGSVLSRGAGAKRKLNISEFFDFSSSRDYRDGGKDGTGGGGGGGKRGRYA
jgi:hypothetical protein